MSSRSFDPGPMVMCMLARHALVLLAPKQACAPSRRLSMRTVAGNEKPVAPNTISVVPIPSRRGQMRIYRNAADKRSGSRRRRSWLTRSYLCPCPPLAPRTSGPTLHFANERYGPNSRPISHNCRVSSARARAKKKVHETDSTSRLLGSLGRFPLISSTLS